MIARAPATSRRWGAGVLLGVLAVLTACSPGSDADPPVPPPTPARVVRYMPLGDSITDGYTLPGGYRTLLWQLLVQQDGDRIDFVGSRSSGPPDLGDADHEGHGGWCIDGPCGQPGTDRAVSPQVGGWITTYQPDIVSVHLGTNDLKKGADGVETARRLDVLVGRIYAAAPDVHVILVQVVTARADVAQDAVYTAAVPGIAARYQTQGRQITVVDMTHLLAMPDNYTDGTHPTKSGYDLMARALYPAVSQAYRELV